MQDLKTQTLEEVVHAITNQPPLPELRVLDEHKIGAAIHQGDVYIHCVAKNHPRGKAWGSNQVAVGTTVGSRHVAEGEGVEVFAGEKLPKTFDKAKMPWLANLTEEQVNRIFLGPVIVAPKGFRLTHPEHAHHDCPEGVYQVTYQGDPRTAERVQD